MSAAFIAFLFGAGVATFAWTKVVRLTGNASPTRSFQIAGIIGVIAFLIFFTFLKWVIHV